MRSLRTHFKRSFKGRLSYEKNSESIFAAVRRNGATGACYVNIFEIGNFLYRVNAGIANIGIASGMSYENMRSIDVFDVIKLIFNIFF